MEFQACLAKLDEVFGKDCFFTLATAKDNVPSARVIDTYYQDGVFWIVTYANSRKGQELAENPSSTLVHNFHAFEGKAYNMGHPLKPENAAIREVLTKVFEPWYFAHNNEGDEHMCFVKFVPDTGFFHTEGTGYRVNFNEKHVDNFPFERDI